MPYQRDILKHCLVQSIADRKTLKQILSDLPAQFRKLPSQTQAILSQICALVRRMNKRGITIHTATAKTFPPPGPKSQPYAPKGLDLAAFKKPRKVRSDKGTKRGEQAHPNPTPATKAKKAAAVARAIPEAQKTQPTKRQEKPTPKKQTKPTARAQKPSPSPALEESIPDAD
jgi:hypothetical protein